ncbi:hypothetical protein D9M68_612390 [compost metagenome]
MAHGMELKIAKGDVLHFLIGRVVFDPVFVFAPAGARMQHGRELIRNGSQRIEAASGQLPHAFKLRQQFAMHGGRQIELEQVLQAPIQREEILAGAIGRKVVGTLGRPLRTRADILVILGLEWHGQLLKVVTRRRA